MKTGILKGKDVIVLSEFDSKYEVVFLDGLTEVVSVFALSDVRYKTTQYNSRSIDFMKLSDTEQLEFIKTHRSARSLMRQKRIEKQMNKGVKKVKKSRAPKVILSPAKQAVLDKLLGIGLRK